MVVPTMHKAKDFDHCWSKLVPFGTSVVPEEDLHPMVPENMYLSAPDCRSHTMVSPTVLRSLNFDHYWSKLVPFGTRVVPEKDLHPIVPENMYLPAPDCGQKAHVLAPFGTRLS